MILFIMRTSKPDSKFSPFAPFHFKSTSQLLYKGSYQLKSETIKVFNIKVFRNAHPIVGDCKDEIDTFIDSTFAEFDLDFSFIPAGKSVFEGIGNQFVDNNS